MYIVVLVFFIIKLEISVSDSQFPEHVDLQKVGDAIFNNEKFNILKTTTHVIKDHFKEVMLREGNDNHPAKRIFIDKNGFRHEWSGFGEKNKSLRKTDLKHVPGSFGSASETAPEPDKILISAENKAAKQPDNKHITLLRQSGTKPVPTNSKNPPGPPKEKTVMTTTFFCPYLGIISMSAFVDD